MTNNRNNFNSNNNTNSSSKEPSTIQTAKKTVKQPPRKPVTSGLRSVLEYVDHRFKELLNRIFRSKSRY